MLYRTQQNTKYILSTIQNWRIYKRMKYNNISITVEKETTQFNECKTKTNDKIENTKETLRQMKKKRNNNGNFCIIK